MSLITLCVSPTQVEIVQLDDKTGEFKSDPNLSFDHPYPPTKIMFIPDKDCQKPDLLATTADILRIWQVAEHEPSGFWVLHFC